MSMGSAVRVAAVVVAVGLVSGCSSDDSAQAAKWRESYCAALGKWQQAKAAASGSAASGYAVVAAAKRLDREGLDRDGGHILDDTAAALDGDADAERRAVTYCEDSGFETMVRGD
jgi:hypothetical protein